MPRIVRVIETYPVVLRKIDGRSFASIICSRLNLSTSSASRRNIWDAVAIIPPRRRCFLCSGTISPSDCSLRARYFLLTPRGKAVASYEISRARLSSLAGRSIYSRVRWREARGEMQELSRARFIQALTARPSNASRFVHYTTVYVRCVCVCVYVCATGDYVAKLLFQRRLATRSDSVTEGNEIRNDETLTRLEQRVVRHPHARTYPRFYSRGVVSALVTPHRGENNGAPIATRPLVAFTLCAHTSRDRTRSVPEMGGDIKICWRNEGSCAKSANLKTSRRHRCSLQRAYAQISHISKARTLFFVYTNVARESSCTWPVSMSLRSGAMKNANYQALTYQSRL